MAGTAGSGIIIDSNGTVLTHARNIFLPIFRSKDNLMLFGEEFMHRWLYEKFYLGNCGGPIVTLDGEVVGISTKIHLLRSLHNAGSCGTTDATGIEEALCNVGYIGKMVPGIINK
ncbi:hypothetical protein IEQ34_006311 [Dendrobium chrysotoxum]|uniref:Uncharacterized protein n=1 Tax=Dendrobium chrysotoxum TaxID=161865 RepID=A0AAV7HF49_DENCH|nr:hypothetical protein IEQ34_006311 [Dendrobium chrysotoxum]